MTGPPDAPRPPGRSPAAGYTNASDGVGGAEEHSSNGGRARRCECDRCFQPRPWPLSEVPPVSRRWLAFEVLRPVDLVLGHGPASWSECVLDGVHPVTGEERAA
jgi:hypothetical protein